MSSDFQIRVLTADDAASVAFLLKAQPPAYLKFFYAIDRDENAIRAKIAACRQDMYLGLFWQKALLSVAMLRGWDEGYDVPSFGILVHYKFKGGAIMGMLLDVCKFICRQSGAKTLMVKVHPSNGTERRIAKLGFHKVSTETGTENVIYHMKL